MEGKHNVVTIGIPELNVMLKEMKKENEERDADLKKILVGNGELGVVGSIEKNKHSIGILSKFLFGIMVSILAIAFWIIRTGMIG